MRACPELSELLCALDASGEASSRDTWCLDHLADCGRCRAAVREHEGLMEAARIHQAGTDCAARGEARLRQALWQVDQERSLARSRVRTRWVFACLSVAAVVLASLIVPRSTTADLDNLLSEAVRRDRDESEWRFVRVQLSRTPVERTATLSETYETSAGSWRAGEGGAGAIVARLRAVGIEVKRPLSAAAFGTWRSAHQRRRDTVWRTRDFFLLQTSIKDAGAVSYGELRLDRNSYRVVGQTWVVAGLGRVDIEGIPALASDRRGSVDAPALPAGPSVDELERLELSVRGVAHELQVDDAISVTIGAGQVHASGAVPEARLYELTRRLIAVSPLIDARAVRRGEAAAISVVTAPPPTLGFNLTDEQRPVVVSEVAQYSRSVARRFAAMDRLARRYSITALPRLSRDRQRELAQLVGDHVQHWQADLLALDARLMLFAGKADRCALPSTVPADWRRRVHDSAQATSAATRDIASVLGSAARPDEQAYRNLSQRLGDIWMHWCAGRPAAPAKD